MRQNTKTRRAAFLLALFLPGCATITNFFSDEPRGPGEVNDLNGSIERVYVDAELARTTTRDAVAALEGMTEGELGEDPAATYTAFVERLEASEEQAETLRDAIDPMNDNAERVFKQWAQDLREFNSPSMLKRSEARLEATRARFEKVRDAAELAHEQLVAVNKMMRDHALFLGHDLNADSLASVKLDVKEMAEDAGKLDASLEGCMESARAYVAASAVKPAGAAQEESAAVVAADAPEAKPKAEPQVKKVSSTKYVR